MFSGGGESLVEYQKIFRDGIETLVGSRNILSLEGGFLLELENALCFPSLFGTSFCGPANTHRILEIES